MLGEGVLLRENHPINHLRKLGPVSAGFAVNFRESPSFRLHLAADLLAALLGLKFRISKDEWLALSTVTVLKATAEMLNTSIEELTDELWSAKTERPKVIKDSAAAAVFATVLGSFATWGMIFIPKLFRTRKGHSP